MNQKVRLTITIDPAVLKRAKECAGLVPLSRWIESVIISRLETTAYSQRVSPVEKGRFNSMG